MTQVLVVEDDSLIRSQLVEILEAEGLQVNSAENGEEALDRLTATQYEVAIVDLRLPGIDGLDVIREAHEVSPNTRMIAVSGFADPDLAAETIRSGACEFLSKPFDLERLTRVIHGGEGEVEAEPSLSHARDSPERSDRMLSHLFAGRQVLHVSLSGEAPALEGLVPESRVHSICETTREENASHKLDLPAQTAEIVSLVKKHPGSAVVIDEFQDFVSEHRWDTVRRWLAQLCESVLPYGSWVGVIIDQDVANERMVMELEEMASDVKTAVIVESLSHPVRRKVIRFLHLRRWATFSAILRQGFTESSPKLSFHLQKLVQRGMLSKDDEGMYGLTGVGQQGHRILRSIQEPEVVEIGQQRALLVTPFGCESHNDNLAE